MCKTKTDGSVAGLTGLTAALFRCVLAVEHTRREEFVGREFNTFEKLAGIVGGRGAFFFGHAEVVDRDEHLDVTSQLYHGKQPKCDQYHAASARAARIQYAADGGGDSFGNVIGARARGRAGHARTGRQNDGIDDLHIRLGQVGLHGELVVAFVWEIVA